MKQSYTECWQLKDFLYMCTFLGILATTCKRDTVKDWASEGNTVSLQWKLGLKY